MTAFYQWLLYILASVALLWAGFNSARYTYTMRRHLLARRYKRGTWWGLNVRKLVVGDIIGVSSGKAGFLIRKLTGGGPLSHVALYIGGNMVVEAVPPRARVEPAASYILSEGSLKSFVLRPKKEVVSFHVDTKRAGDLINEAQLWQSRLYSLIRCVGVKISWVERFAARDATICSELVVHAYRRAGIELCPNLQTVTATPNNIFYSDMLQDVSNLCSKRLTETEFRVVTHASNMRHSRFAALCSWCSAILWAIGPTRLAWSIPPSKWSGFRFWIFYAGCYAELVRHVMQSLLLDGYGRIARSTSVSKFAHETTAALMAYEAQLRDSLNGSRKALKSSHLALPQCIFDVFPNENWSRRLEDLVQRQNVVMVKRASKHLGHCEALLSGLKRELRKRR